MRNRVPHTSHHCWVITNSGHASRTTADPCIIMGAADARQPWNLLHVDRCFEDGIPIVRRFTGGGTVYVDHDTLFCSMIAPFDMLKSCTQFGLIANDNDNQDSSDTKHTVFQPYPKDLLHYTSLFWRRLFERQYGIHDFALQENDFAFGALKFGGNAQYITGGNTRRWLQHTSFLWDYEQKYMDRYLKLPKKIPEYRQNRAHGDFLCKLKDRLHSTTMMAMVEEGQGQERAYKNGKSELMESGGTEVSVSADHFMDAIVRNVHELAENEWRCAVSDVKQITLEEAESFMLPNQVFGTYNLDLQQLMQDQSRQQQQHTVIDNL